MIYYNVEKWFTLNLLLVEELFCSGFYKNIPT